MTLIVYLVCLALLSFLLRNWSQRFRSLLITGFNLVFAALMFFSVQVHPGMTGGEVFALVGSILSAAPSAIAFQGDASLFGPDASYVFLNFCCSFTVLTIWVGLKIIPRLPSPCTR